jgi:hypothetical protein
VTTTIHKSLTKKLTLSWVSALKFPEDVANLTMSKLQTSSNFGFYRNCQLLAQVVATNKVFQILYMLSQIMK